MKHQVIHTAQLREITEIIISRLHLHSLTYDVEGDKITCRKREGSMHEFEEEVYALFDNLKKDVDSKYKVTGDGSTNPRILEDGSMTLKVSLASKLVVPIAPNENPNLILR